MAINNFEKTLNEAIGGLWDDGENPKYKRCEECSGYAMHDGQVMDSQGHHPACSKNAEYIKRSQLPPRDTSIDEIRHFTSQLGKAIQNVKNPQKFNLLSTAFMNFQKGIRGVL